MPEGPEVSNMTDELSKVFKKSILKFRKEIQSVGKFMTSEE